MTCESEQVRIANYNRIYVNNIRTDQTWTPKKCKFHSSLVISNNPVLKSYLIWCIAFHATNSGWLPKSERCWVGNPLVLNDWFGPLVHTIVLKQIEPFVHSGGVKDKDQHNCSKQINAYVHIQSNMYILRYTYTKTNIS